jgi:hypothetical protein
MNQVVAPAAHSVFGGSTAARTLNCPASIGMIEKVPAALRKPLSIYATRGTALHEAMVRLTVDLDETGSLIDRLAGQEINGYVLTADDVDCALRPTLAYVDSLLAPGVEFYIERCIAFPGVPGAFGTTDLLARIDRTAHVIDHKFGQGVAVPAATDGAANPQLMFYAAAARHSHPEFFAGVENIVLTILQPASIDPEAEMVSSVTVSHSELDAFIVAYRAACEEALSESPRLARGPHCRFCPARPICPEHTRPLLDLAELVLPSPGDKKAYLEALAAGLNLVEAVKDMGAALRDQAKAALHNGDVVPGYALARGRAERHWRDECAAIAALYQLGLGHDDIIAESVRSPRQVETRAKARNLKVPPELIDSSHRPGVALVRSENARVPTPGRSELVRTFAAAISALEGAKP